MGLEKAFAKADSAVREGRLWRAKEILQGNVGFQSFDPALYEKYGRLLLRMGDDMEAGRFLFLSGARLEEYHNAIGLYLERFSKGGASGMLGTFPVKLRAQMRNSGYDVLPQSVRDDLHRMGIKEWKAKRDVTSHASSTPFLSKVVPFGCLIVGMFLLACLLAGIPVVLKNLGRLLF